MTTGRHHGRTGAERDQRGARRPAAGLDDAAVAVVDVDRLAHGDGRAAGDAYGVFGFGEVGADEVGPGGRRLDEPPAGDVDGDRRPSVVGERDQRGVRTGIDAGRDAAAHGHPRAADDALFHRRQDASPGATVERRAGLVDHGGPAAVLEDDGGPADLAVDRHRVDVEAFGERAARGRPRRGAPGTARPGEPGGPTVRAARQTFTALPPGVTRASRARSTCPGASAGSRMVRSIVWLRPTTSIDASPLSLAPTSRRRR